MIVVIVMVGGDKVIVVIVMMVMRCYLDCCAFQKVQENTLGHQVVRVPEIIQENEFLLWGTNPIKFAVRRA